MTTECANLHVLADALEEGAGLSLDVRSNDEDNGYLLHLRACSGLKVTASATIKAKRMQIDLGDRPSASPDVHPLAALLPTSRWFHDVRRNTTVILMPGGLWLEFDSDALWEDQGAWYWAGIANCVSRAERGGAGHHEVTIDERNRWVQLGRAGSGGQPYRWWQHHGAGRGVDIV